MFINRIIQCIHFKITWSVIWWAKSIKKKQLEHLNVTTRLRHLKHSDPDGFPNSCKLKVSGSLIDGKQWLLGRSIYTLPILKLMNTNMRGAWSACLLKVDSAQMIPAMTWNDAVWIKHELLSPVRVKVIQPQRWCQVSLQCEAGNDISVQRAQLPLHRFSTSLLWPFTEEAIYQLKSTPGKLGKGSVAVWASSHRWLNLTGEGIFHQLSPIKANKGRTSAFEGWSIQTWCLWPMWQQRRDVNTAGTYQLNGLDWMLTHLTVAEHHDSNKHV